MDAQRAQPDLLALPAEAAALQAAVLGLHQKLQQRDLELVESKAIIAERDARVAELQVQLSARAAELQQHKQQWELEKLRLEHQLELYLKRYYGPRADKADTGQLLLEFAQELEKRPLELEIAGQEPSESCVQPRRVRRGRRNLRLFEQLPKLTKVHDLSQEQKQELAGEGKLVELAPEITWQVDYVPGHFYRIEHVQKKYAAVRAQQREADEKTQIVLAEKPAQPIYKGMAGPGLLAYVVSSKYGDYLPLYRLENIFDRNGLEISRSTMSLWCSDVADIVRPVYLLMKQRVLGGHVIGTDDTVMPLLAPEKTRQARIWIYRGDDDHPYNVFDFTLSRGRDGPNDFLGAYKAVLLGDAYGAYGGICVQKQITKAGCWAHARRKFVDCQKVSQEICVQALELMGKLFATERSAREKQLDADKTLALRQEKSLPVIEALRGKLEAWKLSVLPRHPVAGAIGYVLNQWEPLRVFLKDGAVALDNNLAEQEMKRIALLRKNALFVGTERGGETAAILSSLTSTCRRLGVNPQLYLTQALMGIGSTPLSQVGQWLPDVWQKRCASETNQPCPSPLANVVA